MSANPYLAKIHSYSTVSGFSPAAACYYRASGAYKHTVFSYFSFPFHPRHRTPHGRVEMFVELKTIGFGLSRNPRETFSFRV